MLDVRYTRYDKGDWHRHTFMRELGEFMILVQDKNLVGEDSYTGDRLVYVDGIGMHDVMVEGEKYDFIYEPEIGWSTVSGRDIW
jgi:hypothetical protein